MKKFLSYFKKLYMQVLIAMVIGILLGHFEPDLGVKMKPFSDVFIKMIKMVIGPLVFTTLVAGIAGMSDIKHTGVIGLKALIYFEIATTLALILGMVSVKLFEPGVGANIDPSILDEKLVSNYRDRAVDMDIVSYLMHIVPSNVFEPFTGGDLIQVVFFAVLFSFALNFMGEKGRPFLNILKDLSQVFFGIVHIIVYFAPIAAFGAMAFTIGKFGIETLETLWRFVALFYGTCLFFIIFVLGFFAALAKVNIWHLIKYLKDEILIVFSASSSESALPLLMEKMRKLGIKESIVDLVVPTGYSFNLDGICIYMTLAALFIAQAMNIELTLTQELTLLAITLLTSKGAAGVTGSGFIVLASTLAVFDYIPVAGMVIILGVDRFMSEARAVTSFIGNAVATIFVARLEGNFVNQQILKKEII